MATELEQSLDELGASITRRLERDAETIRELVVVCRQARDVLIDMQDIRGVPSIIADIDKAIALTKGK